MDLRNLNTFIQVAESGSFTRAAAQLGYSQPTISVQIKQLEEELGIKLFERIGHTVRLTDKGRDALLHAQSICHQCQQMLTQTSHPDVPHGTVRLATADSMCAPLISRNFAGFRSRYPSISLKVITAGTDDLFRLLDHNEVDLVCTMDSHIYNTNYVILAEQRMEAHFVVSSRHPLAKASAVPIEQLLGQPFLLTEKGMSYRRLLDERLARSSMEIQPVLETGRADLICSLVEENAGVGFLPDYVTAQSVRKGKLVRLKVQDFRVVVWKQLLYRREKWVSQPMQAMIDHISRIRLVQR